MNNSSQQVFFFVILFFCNKLISLAVCLAKNQTYSAQSDNADSMKDVMSSKKNVSPKNLDTMYMNRYRIEEKKESRDKYFLYQLVCIQLDFPGGLSMLFALGDSKSKDDIVNR